MVGAWLVYVDTYTFSVVQNHNENWICGRHVEPDLPWMTFALPLEDVAKYFGHLGVAEHKQQQTISNADKSDNALFQNALGLLLPTAHKLVPSPSETYLNGWMYGDCCVGFSYALATLRSVKRFFSDRTDTPNPTPPTRSWTAADCSLVQ